MKKEIATIIEQQEIAADIFSMWIGTELAAEAKPGQFLSLYCHEGSRLLPRPISICEIDAKHRRLRLVYRIAGKGTAEFSRMQTGDHLAVLGPLGNGFPLEHGGAGTKALLIGGGIGIPPMLELAKQLAGKVQIVAGYLDETFLTAELHKAGSLYVATESGAAGIKGNVLDAVRGYQLEADVIFACGPTPMLRAVKAYAGEQEIQCWISLEERMACGVGACLGCVCKTADTDHHTNVNNRRICKDGPVFRADEVII